MMKKLEFKTARVFEPLYTEARYYGVFGGRGSGKSNAVAQRLIDQCITNPKTRILCAREVQKSIKYSSKKLLEDWITKLDLWSHFTSLENEIRLTGASNRSENGVIYFVGLSDASAESVKSLENFDIAWLEEAATISEKSWNLLTPTFRKPGSKIFCTWNPRSPKDPIDNFFRGESKHPNAITIEANYYDNPFLSEEAIEEAEVLKAKDYEKYEHVWLGQYEKNSEARIFRNFTIQDFKTPEDANFLFGLDFGYSRDPLVLTRCFFGDYENNKVIANDLGKTLFIDYSFYQDRCEVVDTPRAISKVPDSSYWPIRCDSARPEIISYLKKHGYPLATRSLKGANSIVDGISFVNSFDIVIHDRCERLIEDFSNYKYKVNKLTEEISNKPGDKYADGPDSVRYAVEAAMKKKKKKLLISVPMQVF